MTNNIAYLPYVEDHDITAPLDHSDHSARERQRVKPLISELCQRMSIPMMPYMLDDFLRIEKIWALEPDALRAMANDTARARKPSWAYLMAIGRNCYYENVHTYVEYVQRQKKHYEVTHRVFDQSMGIWEIDPGF